MQSVEPVVGPAPDKIKFGFLFYDSSAGQGRLNVVSGGGEGRKNDSLTFGVSLSDLVGLLFTKIIVIDFIYRVTKYKKALKTFSIIERGNQMIPPRPSYPN